MPSSSDRLREKFLKPPDDGIAKCEGIIRAAGGDVNYGVIFGIKADTENDEMWDAIQYLVEEWDYAVEYKRV